MSDKDSQPPIQFRIRTLLVLQAFVIPIGYIFSLLWHKHWTNIFFLLIFSWLGGVVLALRRIHMLRTFLCANDRLDSPVAKEQLSNADLLYQIRWTSWSDLQNWGFVGSMTTGITLCIMTMVGQAPRMLLDPELWIGMCCFPFVTAPIGAFIAPWCGLAYARLLRWTGVWS